MQQDVSISEVGKQDRCDSTVKYTLSIIHLYMADGGVGGILNWFYAITPALFPYCFTFYCHYIVTFVVSPISWIFPLM